MSIFTTTLIPYTTTDTNGDQVTILALVEDTKLLGVKTNRFGDQYAVLYRSDGSEAYDPSGKACALNPPNPTGLDAYNSLNPNIRDLINVTIKHGHKISGVKALCSLLNIGLSDAKALWEHLADG